MNVEKALGRPTPMALFCLVVGACGSDDSPRVPRAPDSRPPPTEVVANVQAAWAVDEGWSVSSEPRLTIGTEGDERYHFSVIAAAALQSDGDIVVVDAGASVVRLFDADGTLQELLGGRGSGPGEFQLPSDVLIGPDDSIVVWDDQLWRRTTFDPEGSYVADRSFQPDAVWETTAPLYSARAILSPDGGLIALLKEKAKDNPRGGTFRLGAGAVRVSSGLDSFSDLARFPGEEQVIVDSPWGPLPTVPALARRSLMTRHAKTGRWCHGDQARAEVLCEQEGGAVLAIQWIDRASTNRDRREAVDAWRESAFEEYRQKLSSDDARRLVDRIPVADAPLFDRILLDDTGHLWVDLGPDEIGRTFLVFGERGRLLGSVVTPDIRVLEVGPDYLLGVDEDDLGVQRLVLHDLAGATATNPESS